MSWSTAALDDLCGIDVGRTPARKEPRFWGPGEPWLSIADMSQGRTITTTKEQITAAGAAGGRQVARGTVLLSFKLSIGKVARAGMPLYTNEAIAALPVKRPDRLDEAYLCRALESLDLAFGSNRAAMGNTLNKTTLKQIQIPLPPLPEQRRIAAILDHADSLRAKRRRVLAHLDSLTQAIFAEMFSTGDFDPVRAGVLMPNMRNGLSPATSGMHEARVLTLASITHGSFNPSAAKPGVFAIEPGADKRITNRDFLMCRGNGNRDLVGVGTYARENHPDLVFPDTIIAGMVDTTRVTLPFLEAAWKRRDVRAQIESAARTTNGTYKVNQQTLSGVVVRVPPLDLQEAFAVRVARVGHQHAAVQRATTADNELFASLQARAFQGKL